METATQRIRAERSKPTPASKAAYNQKCSMWELETRLAVNFDSQDHVITFTYDDRHLPRNKNVGGFMFQEFIRILRRKRGEDLKYIFVTEGFHERREGDGDLENGRIHHHAVINAAGPGDLDELRSLWLWQFGGYLRAERFGDYGCSALAAYLTKEAREFGRQKPGERTWRASLTCQKAAPLHFQES